MGSRQATSSKREKPRPGKERGSGLVCRGRSGSPILVDEVKDDVIIVRERRRASKAGDHLR